jgi:hypothetical protein
MNMPPMEPMSVWRLALDNPEWAGVFANSLFAATTIAVIIWQVRVMTWQGRNSERHERIQNRLIRLQHEHSWVLRLNAEREQLLKLGRKLYLAANALKEKPTEFDPLRWVEVQETVTELSSRLQVLDVAAFTGPFDRWYINLRDYVEAVQKAWIDDSSFNQTFSLSSDSPTLSTRKTLKEAGERCDIIGTFLEIEGAIRMEFHQFKKKWDDALPS